MFKTKMARNFTKHYLTYGEDDFDIYEGETPEEEITTHEEAYFAGGGEGPMYGGFDEEHIDAIIDDSVAMFERELVRKEARDQALRHAEDLLNEEMSEEDYLRFLHNQRKEHHRDRGFQLVLDEFHNYVPEMLEARKMFLEHAGLPMLGKLMELEQKKLFYF